MLLSGHKVCSASISTPAGIIVRTEIKEQILNCDSASCAVVKDSGDDPDVTNGIMVYAEVSCIESGIEITGGKGIGKVTKPGLDQPVGEYAINSVPRKMIEQSVKEAAEIYEYKGGFRIVISIPQGEEIAKKTFNPRMGIVGGISVIGTTGIVEPMSSSAIVETIRTEANMRKANGHEYLLLNVGNYSEDFIKLKNEKLSDRTVTCSNFIGDAFDIGVALGFKGILIIGHIGKLVKLGSGIMNTHSSYADGRMETLISCGVAAGVSNDILVRLLDCVTTDAAIDILIENNAADAVFKVLVERVEHYIAARVHNEVEIGAVIFSTKNNILLKTSKADELIKHISEE